MSYIGTTSPVTPVIGTVRYDTTSNQVQAWDGNQWVQVVSNTAMWNERKLTCEDLRFGDLWFYKVVAEGYDFDELNEWCNQTFGPPRTDRSNHTHKWFISGGDFYFHEEKLRTWFVLKWSSDGNNNV